MLDPGYSFTKTFEGKKTAVLSKHTSSSASLSITALLLESQKLICKFIKHQWVQVVRIDTSQFQVITFFLA